ncbi:MAG: protein kinase, partial [Gemmatimonadetes bacterium]|nr:protein kinase [Gemmatimonadota bacterium]
EGELPVPEAARLLRDVVDALAAAHAKGIVHRDIKPENVMLSGHHAMVTDFGVAKAVSEATGRHPLTTKGVALGTPAYMAPEQAAGEPNVDHRADIYAVGVLGYELLTGLPPFSGSTAQQILTAQVIESPRPVREHRESVPPTLEAIVMRCLEKKPADRWQSAEEMLPHLEAVATASGGMTPTDLLPVTKTDRKRRSFLPWILAPVALAVVAFAVAWWGGRETAGPRAPAAGGPTRAATGSGAPSATRRHMIVVLPFENLGAPDDAYFADGVTEELTSRLAMVSGIGVISRTTAVQYRNTTKTVKQIGEELGVDYVLEGTVRWARSTTGAGQVRVTPQLIRVADDSHVWTGTYDRELRDIFQIQSEMALSVVEELNVALAERQRQLLSERPTENMEAYDYYLRGNDYSTRTYTAENLLQAVAMYQKAAELDPAFWWAHMAVAMEDSWIYSVGVDHTPARCAGSREALERATVLAPGHPYVRRSWAWYHYRCFLNYGLALAELDSVAAEVPNDPGVLQLRSYIERRQGKFDESASHGEQALVLNPRDATGALQLALTYDCLRRYRDARRHLETVARLRPAFADTYAWLAEVMLKATGSVDSALAVMQASSVYTAPDDPGIITSWLYFDLVRRDYDSALRRIARMDPSETEFQDAVIPVPYRRAQVEDLMGRREAARRDYEEARAFLEARLKEQPEDARLYTTLGQVYAALGRREDARRASTRAVSLVPTSKDALAGPSYEYDRAVTLTMVGDTATALDALERVLAVPSYFDPVNLRVEPWWDPLRDNPRFRRLAGG